MAIKYNLVFKIFVTLEASWNVNEKIAPFYFVLKVFPFTLNCQTFGTIPLMGDRPVLMHHAVFKLQLSATCSVLNFMYIIELDFYMCFRKMAVSVGVHFLANAEQHFVSDCQIVITAPSCVLHRTQMHYTVLLVAADVGGPASPSNTKLFHFLEIFRPSTFVIGLLPRDCKLCEMCFEKVNTIRTL
jgi:hypothetical protein